MRSLLITCALLSLAPAVRGDQIIVGGTEKQSLYPFRCC
jgi:hypothetical protein